MLELIIQLVVLMSLKNYLCRLLNFNRDGVSFIRNSVFHGVVTTIILAGLMKNSLNIDLPLLIALLIYDTCFHLVLESIFNKFLVRNCYPDLYHLIDGFNNLLIVVLFIHFYSNGSLLKLG